ncbi:MAG: (2Fe-2S) ferredoxin domain-containing protein [Candidatus Cloacimonetes bacterium]|nr:(2Fe-2S) ferredoxin domain-containing protein [Candidatus Cloacimonadota bacterium]
MEITVCVGSSCHIRGSHSFIDYLQKAIATNKLEKHIVLKASFCIGHCSEGINIKVNDERIVVTGLDDLKELFTNRLIEEAKKETCTH